MVTFDISVEGIPPGKDTIHHWKLATAEYLTLMKKKVWQKSLRAAAMTLGVVSVVVGIIEYTEVFKSNLGDLSGAFEVLFSIIAICVFFFHVSEKVDAFCSLSELLNDQLEDITTDSDLNQEILEFATNVPEIRSYIAQVNGQGRPLIYKEHELFQDYHGRYDLIVAVRELNSIRADNPACPGDTANAGAPRRVSV